MTTAPTAPTDPANVPADTAAAKADAPAAPPPDGRIGIVGAVNTPLGFYVVCLLIVEAAITLVLGTADFDQSARFAGLLLSSLLFIIVVFLTTHLAIFHPRTLVFGSKDYHISELIGRMSGADALRRALDKLDDSTSPQLPLTPSAEPKGFVPEFDGVTERATAGVRQFLELESHALARLGTLLPSGWTVQTPARIEVPGGARIEVDAVAVSPDGKAAVVIETKLVPERGEPRGLLSALTQLDRATQVLLASRARVWQLLLLLPRADQVQRATTLLEPYKPIFQNSLATAAVYDPTADQILFVGNTPFYITRG